MTSSKHVRLVLLLVLLGIGAACSPGKADLAELAEPADMTGTDEATSTTEAPVRPTADVDELVPVGSSGARMHLSCTGSGPSTVVFVSGFGDEGDSWGAVTPAVTRDARVCTYARFGLGTSDAPPSAQTFATQAADLHQLLQAAGEPGPYVVVGHSFGGDVAVRFASDFADEVDGLLLLDASPIEWPTAACAIRDTPVTGGSWADTCASYADNPEHLDTIPAFADMTSVESLGDMPMAVLTRADLEYPGLPARSVRQLRRVWNEGQDHWESLSSSATLVPVVDTSHYIQLDQPAIVIDQLHELLP